ncbi:MAG: biopolymer transporter ExbD [Gemmatimonadetes bacterium]|nr:biopolymer transporter ExbD [Gemmatimonadota bacterium]
MAISGGKFQKSSKASEEIPSSSLADIAFLLLIFFMVTTVFQQDKERPIDWPEAEAAQKMDEKQKNILNIWMEQDGKVYVNDAELTMDQVTAVVTPLYVASDQKLQISIRGDRDVPYQYMDQLQQALIRGGVLRVTFAAELETNIQRERR